VQQVVKHFDGIKAVEGVSFTVKDRTLHALIGPNGAGKTTAFNLLSGMYPPDQGTVSLLGQPIAGHTPEEIATAGIGRSFQITNLFPTLSVGENIRLAVQARHPRPDLGFARSALAGASQQDEPRREALLIELDAVIGPPRGLGAQDARRRDGCAEDHNGIGGYELRLDGHPEAQPVGERSERGGEEERDPDEPRQSESAVQAQDALILDDRRRPARVRKGESASRTCLYGGI
jgi:ABC-type Fe3+/spermidine/putrescine transport system ATPase subunit